MRKLVLKYGRFIVMIFGVSASLLLLSSSFISKHDAFPGMYKGIDLIFGNEDLNMSFNFLMFTAFILPLIAGIIAITVQSREGISVSIGLFIIGILLLFMFKETKLTINVTVKFKLSILGWLSVLLSLFGFSSAILVLNRHKFY